MSDNNDANAATADNSSAVPTGTADPPARNSGNISIGKTSNRLSVSSADKKAGLQEPSRNISGVSGISDVPSLKGNNSGISGNNSNPAVFSRSFSRLANQTSRVWGKYYFGNTQSKSFFSNSIPIGSSSGDRTSLQGFKIRGTGVKMQVRAHGWAENLPCQIIFMIFSIPFLVILIVMFPVCLVLGLVLFPFIKLKRSLFGGGKRVKLAKEEILRISRKGAGVSESEAPDGSTGANENQPTGEISINIKDTEDLNRATENRDDNKADTTIIPEDVKPEDLECSPRGTEFEDTNPGCFEELIDFILILYSLIAPIPCLGLFPIGILLYFMWENGGLKFSLGSYSRFEVVEGGGGTNIEGLGGTGTVSDSQIIGMGQGEVQVGGEGEGGVGITGTKEEAIKEAKLTEGERRHSGASAKDITLNFGDH